MAKPKRFVNRHWYHRTIAWESSGMFAQKYKKIGLKIAYYRKLKGYTQEDLARRAQISTSYLSRIERGNYTKSVSLSVLLTLAMALEIDIGELICDRNPN